MSHEDKLDIEHIKSLYQDSRVYYQSYRDNWIKYYKQYRSILDVDVTKDFYKWRSQLFIPASARALDGLMPDLLLAFFTPNPFFNVFPRKPESVKQAEANEALLNYQFDEANFPSEFEIFLRQMGLYGASFGKVHWKKETVEEVVEEGVLGLPDIKRDIDIYDGPVFEPIDIFNIFISPTATSLSDTWVIHRSEKTQQEVQKLIDRGIYNKVPDLDNLFVSDESTEKYYQQERKGLQGLPTTYSRGTSSDKGKKYNKIEVLEYWTMDREKTITILGQRVKVREKERPFNIPRFDPFVMCKLTNVPFEAYGIGIMEKAQDLQDQLNSEVNQRLDNRNLRQNMIVKVRRGANINVRNIMSKPGAVWLTDDMTAIDPVQIPDLQSASSFAEEKLLKQEIEEITGVSSATIGGVSTSKSRQTATESSLMQRAGSKMFAMLIKQIEEQAMKPIIRKFYQLNSKFITQDKVIRIIGGKKGMNFLTVTPNDVVGDYDFIPAASTQLIDKNLKVQQMMTFLGIVQQDPSFNRQEFYKRIWESWGYKDFADLINPVPQVPLGMGQQGGQAGPQQPPREPMGMRAATPQEGSAPIQMMQR